MHSYACAVTMQYCVNVYTAIASCGFKYLHIGSDFLRGKTEGQKDRQTEKSIVFRGYVAMGENSLARNFSYEKESCSFDPVSVQSV